MAKQHRAQYNVAFEEILAQLNPQQRKAVEQIDGPVLVVAGPGTGKTHILSARIGQILQQTDVYAHNILCLTFTEAGVLAMRQRLLTLIGPEAHRVHIYTFHSFCNNIIQENMELFGRHDLEPLSDLERVELVRQIIDQLPFDHPLKRGRSDVYFYENHLFDLFKRMKSEAWSVQWVHQQIDAYLESLPHRPEFVYKRKSGPYRKGDPKEAKIAEVQEKMERLRAAATLYPAYETALRAAHRYDFDDMILWVLRAFRQHPTLLRSYQERYLYFLVDEYQDTNGAQNEILQQLISYWENPNIFIVGDDDQSIYEFQGARLRNITDFYDAYKNHVEVVVLQHNYRSTQSILDTARALIEHNEKRLINTLEDLDVQKILEAQHPKFAGSRIVPEIIEYDNRLHEVASIAEQISALQQKGIPLNEVAVIYAQHRQALPLVQLLEKQGIPYQSKKQVNILHQPLIQNLRNLLTYIDLEHHQALQGEYLLFQILHFDFWQIPAADLLKLSVWMAKERRRRSLHWRTVLDDTDILEELSLRAPEKWQHIAQCIHQWTSDYSNLSLPMLLERIINQSGLMPYLLQHEDRLWLVQLVHSFFDFVQKEVYRRPRLKLRGLLDVLQQMDANRLPIEVNRTIYADDGVQLLTAHSSKGLEFRYVFILDVVQDFWEPKTYNRRRFSLPDTLTYSGEEDALEARRRLFYVALTRAKEYLYVSYSRTHDTGKALQRSRFIDEILEHNHQIELQTPTPSNTQIATAQIRLLTETPVPEVPLPDKKLMRHLLEGFVLSVSALNRYLKCPLSFYYEYVLKVPTLMRPAAAYGTAMHYALMKLFDKMMASPDRHFPSAEYLVQQFEKEMQRQRPHFGRLEYQHRLEKGRHILPLYYRQYKPTWATNVKTELDVRSVELEGVPIKGVIDRIDFINSTTASIEDYKTGSTDAKKLRQPSSKNPLGGSYWRQLVFYKVLYESGLPAQHKIQSGSIAYLAPDAQNVFTKRTLTLSYEDTQFMKRLIKETWKKIKSLEFSEGCNESYCTWCTFLKNNRPIDTFSDADIEALDD